VAFPVTAAKKQATDTPKTFALDDLLTRENLWTLSQPDVAKSLNGGGFAWLDAQKSTARGGPAVELQFLNQRIWEALFHFENNHISRVDLSFYNRGDAGDLGTKAFGTLLDKVSGSISNWMDAAAKPLPDVLGPARSKIQHVAWTKAATALDLEWSVTKPHTQNGEQISYRSEFIRLKLLPAAAVTNQSLPRVGAPRPATGRSAAELKARVHHSSSNDVAIADIPMVDQGAKGYCAAAVMARVMGYYGLDFDEHQAAQVAGTSSVGGTKGGNVRDALKRIAQKNNLRLVQVEDFDVMHLINDYNRAASSAHKPKVSIESTGHSMDGLLRAMEPEILHQARTKRQSDLVRFRGDVTKYVDTGIPLIWDVYLGLVKEPMLAPQASGGHLRLIIGYNKEADEVLYSDSWGAAHALKHLSLGDAMTMTFGLFVIKPNGL